MTNDPTTMLRAAAAFVIALQIGAGPVWPVSDTGVYGGYNGAFIPSGLGLKKNLPRTAPLAAGSSWSLYCWIRAEEALTGRTLIAGIGDLASTGQRYFAAIDGKLAFWAGGENILASPKTLDPDTWHLVQSVSTAKP